MAKSLFAGVRSLLDALRAAGADVVSDEGRPPLQISSHGLAGGLLHVDASASSQFATALLLVGPYADGDLIVEVGGLRELGYVRLTLRAMARWGASVAEEALQGERASSLFLKGGVRRA